MVSDEGVKSGTELELCLFKGKYFNIIKDKTILRCSDFKYLTIILNSNFFDCWEKQIFYDVLDLLPH